MTHTHLEKIKNSLRTRRMDGVGDIKKYGVVNGISPIQDHENKIQIRKTHL